MKKRILSAMLTPMLLFSIAVPGIAAERGDSADRLAAVTGKVKNALGLNTEQYKTFSGQLTEGELAPTWRLSWSGESGSLEITASEAGRIVSYSCYGEDEMRDSAALSLPKFDPAKAKAAAAAFLSRVLDSRESVDLEAADRNEASLRQTRYYFQGDILLNGCPSPLRFSLTVRTSDYAVVQFRRDTPETDYIGLLPPASFQTQQSAAESILRSTLSMRLEYVLAEGKNTAVLRYLPNSTHSYYVDDASGTLVDLTKLYEELGKNAGGSEESAMFSAPAAADADRNNGLTQAEQLGADKLKGTLSREALDQKARSIAPLGLDSYTLASASYREEAAEQAVILARLSYAKRAEDETFRRTVTLNAKTGALLGVSSSRPYSPEEARQVSEDAARNTAEAFLKAQQGDRFARCAAYCAGSACAQENGQYGTWRFQYARQENGYPFPNDQFTVAIDTLDGSVSAYTQAWSEDTAFESPNGIIPMEQAVGAYFQTFQVTKGYAAVPQKLDLSDPEYAPLAKIGYRAFNSLKLGWQLTAPEHGVLGIDAKTGQPVFWSDRTGEALQYSDLAGSRAKLAAETLAEYGIGYAGGAFRPNKGLTQLDLAALLASTQGTPVDPDNLTEEDADRVYRTAYSMGMLRREERSDSRLLSRLEVIKFLLDSGGYGSAARLQGIYHTDFSDETDIPGALLGYAALAQAMGVAQGDSTDRLNPGRPATRADAAIMLLAFMQRN